MQYDSLLGHGFGKFKTLSHWKIYLLLYVS
jgi:hypothetical protein